VEVARSIKQKGRREIRLVLPTELGNQTRRGGESQSWAPIPRVSHRQSERFIPPRVIQIEMKSAGNQKLVVRVPKKRSVACFGDPQIFLGFFVFGIQAQRFTELNNGLRNLALTQEQFAQIIIRNC